MAPGFRKYNTGGGKRKRRKETQGDLLSKVNQTSGRLGFALEKDPHSYTDDKSSQRSGVYGGRSKANLSRTQRTRSFGAASVSSRKQAHTADQHSIASMGKSSKVRRSGRPRTIKSRPASAVGNANSSAVHIVCAISENLAKETCVASLDAGSPTSLHVAKQGNGQTYTETLAYLEVLQPDEILLNEGRQNSQLAHKILSRFSCSFATQIPTDSRYQGQGRTTYAPRSRRQFHTTETSLHSEVREDKGPNSACRTSTVVKFISRSHFDQTKGAHLLRRVARSETYDGSLADEYILLSSTHAVLQYTELCLGASFGRKCVQIYINAGGNNRMTIDRSSLLQLEFLANAKTGRTGESLIGTIDCTKTTVGSRLLRTNLMAPPTRVDTINTRLDLVDSLLDDEEFFFTVMEHLESLPDVDKMLTNIALIPWTKSKDAEDNMVTARIASKGISALVCIKSILISMPNFALSLEDQLKAMEVRTRMQRQQCETGGPCDRNIDARSTVTNATSLLVGLGGSGVVTKPQRNQLLRAISMTMRQPGLTEVLDAVNNIFTDSTSFTRNAHAMRHEECFALKPKTDGMMDVIRKAFLANVDDIYRLADEYAGKHNIRVNVKESSGRGYFLVIPHETGTDLPQEFIQSVKAGKFVHCTTEEVRSLNARAQENVQDLLLMTHERIHEVLEFARSRYDHLASLSDAIALLDMCHSFADNVSSSPLPWSRPTVNTGGGGTLTIQKGRYGIDVASSGLGTRSTTTGSIVNAMIPNDTYAPGHRNFTVLTGVNGSGKSTYLKQIAIIVVLAHCGSYVPAESAIVPIRDRLCTRIGTGDDQEQNISTFMLEMKETAFICCNAGPKSLILIDELGRATSNEDGVAIAWSVSEFLLAKRAMTFFVTHYPQLAKLSEVYSGVQNQHMGASISMEQNGEVCYSHKVMSGACSVSSDYGVEMSASCGWPDDVVQLARNLQLEVEEKLPNGGLALVETASKQTAIKRSFQTAQFLAGELQKLKGITDHGVISLVLQQMKGVVPSSDTELIEGIKALLFESYSEQEVSEHASEYCASDHSNECHQSSRIEGATGTRTRSQPQGNFSSNGSDKSSLGSSSSGDSAIWKRDPGKRNLNLLENISSIVAPDDLLLSSDDIGTSSSSDSDDSLVSD